MKITWKMRLRPRRELERLDREGEMMRAEANARHDRVQVLERENARLVRVAEHAESLANLLAESADRAREIKSMMVEARRDPEQTQVVRGLTNDELERQRERGAIGVPEV